MRYSLRLWCSALAMALLASGGCSGDKPEKRQTEAERAANLAKIRPLITKLQTQGAQLVAQERQGGVTPGATVPSAVPAKPEWAQTFLKAIRLLGKKKDDVVAAFGPPPDVGGRDMEKPGGLAYSYHPSGPYFVEFWFSDIKVRASRDNPFNPTYSFDPKDEANRKVIDIGISLWDPMHMMNYQGRMDAGPALAAGDIWKYLGGEREKPKTLCYSLSFQSLFWKDPNGFYVRLPGLPIRLRGHLQGGTYIAMEGGNQQAPFLEGTRKFSTALNSYETGPPTRNEAFSWAATRIEYIYVGDPDHVGGYESRYFDTEIPTP